MSTLTITRGLPGAGKAKWAHRWRSKAPESRAVLETDRIRRIFKGVLPAVGMLNHGPEPTVLATRDKICALLLGKGLDVIVVDTHLPFKDVRHLATLATRSGSGFAVRDFTGVSLSQCIRRDEHRERPVGVKELTRMWHRLTHGGGLPDDIGAARPAPEPYMPLPGAPKAALVDIDGTVALRNGRNPYDWSRVREDLPNQPVIDTVDALHRAGHHIVFLSGRSEVCRADTSAWLLANIPSVFEHPANCTLLMRPAADHRPDVDVKLHLFEEHVRRWYSVTAVLDDRQQVVDMWRSLGLTVLQVAPGDF
ncbi:hypothetical protein GCM10022221_67500 [Actinocorallia aurea]